MGRWALAGSPQDYGLCGLRDPAALRYGLANSPGHIYMNQRAEEHEEVEDPQADQGALALMSGAELDRAQRYAESHPRSVALFRREALQLATIDEVTADECIYALPRAGKTIEGPSIRFAEILLYAWRNIDAGTRPIMEERDTLTAQGVFRDLERNNRVTREVSRRIVDSKGRRYNADMITTTSNAAASIALRNAIFNGIPRALWWGIYLEVRKVVAGDSKTFANKRAETLQALQKVGVSLEMVLAKYGHKGLDDISTDNVVELRGLRNGIRDGEITPEEAFKPLAVEDDTPAATSRADVAKEALRRQQAQQQPASTTEQPKEEPKKEEPKAAAETKPPVEPEKPKASAKGAKKPAEKSAELPFWNEQSAIADICKTTTVTACEELYDKICADLGPRNNGVIPDKVQSAYADWHAHLAEQV